MDIAFPRIPHHRLCVFPITRVPLNLNSQAPINLQLETNLIVHQTSPRIVASLDSLQL